MNKIINVVALCALAFGAVKLYEYQYKNGSYYKQYYSRMSVQEQYKELECLTENIYYEAAGESLPGKIAVAQLTLQRVESSKRSTRFKDSICKVVHQSSEFSWVKDKPRALVKRNEKVYNDSREVAKKVLWEGERISAIDKPNVLYYHAEYVKPFWANEFKFVAKIDKHLYYERNENGKW